VQPGPPGARGCGKDRCRWHYSHMTAKGTKGQSECALCRTKQSGSQEHHYLHDEHGDTQAPDITSTVVDPLLATDPLHLSHNLRGGIEWCANRLSAAVAIVLHSESPISEGGIEPVVEIEKSRRVDGGGTVVIALVGKHAAQGARIVVGRQGVLGADTVSLRGTATGWDPVFLDLEQDVFGLIIVCGVIRMDVSTVCRAGTVKV